MPSEAADAEPLIAAVVRRYWPSWEPPSGCGTWLKTSCPWHGDEHASASVSYEYNAFRCHGCEMRGDAIKLIRTQEGVSFAEAKRIIESLPGGSDYQVPQQLKRKPSRRVFTDEGSASDDVSPRVRSRSVGWA